MAATQDIIEALVKRTPGGYHVDGQPASEPTAWAALALTRAGNRDAARRATDWLAGIQQRDGSVGVNAQQATPAWPTSLAMLAWQEVSPREYTENITRALGWTLEAKGRTTPRKRQVGHDTTLVGWSWAADTHSWLEPTAMFVRALHAVGQGSHPRTTEAVKLLVDRLLPSGGANYGNTLVLGQELLPHVQPTGIVLWSLEGLAIDDPRIQLSADYLQESLSPETSTASLAYGILGLTAVGQRPANADDWLRAAAERELAKNPAPYKLALLTLALSKTSSGLAATTRF